MKRKLALPALAGLAASSAPGAGAVEGRTCTRAAVGSAGIAVRTACAELAAVPLGDPETKVDPSTSRRIEEKQVPTDRLRPARSRAWRGMQRHRTGPASSLS